MTVLYFKNFKFISILIDRHSKYIIQTYKVKRKYLYIFLTKLPIISYKLIN